MTENTNGTTSTAKPAKEPSLLSKLHKEWVAKGGKLPSKADKMRLVKALETALTEKERAEAAVEAAREKVAAASLACIQAFGGEVNIPINGVPHAPMTRGEQVYYRTLGSSKMLDLHS